MAKQLIVAMLYVAAFLISVAAASLPKTGLKADGTSKIKHIVVAMLENRAFDHMLGWMGQWGMNVDGLTGNETNTIVMFNGTKQIAQVASDCPYINPFDPMHNVLNTTNEVMNGAQWLNPAPMSGFAQAHYNQGLTDPQTVMHGFSPDRVPAISTLAKNFAVFDKYFSSIPGPTLPNRMYFHSGTSHGMIQDVNFTTLLPGAPQTSVYDVLEANNLTWRSYFEDIPDVLLMKNQRTWEQLENLKWLDDFAKDCQKGDLPYYTWVTPRFYADFGKKARDQHPDHDVVLGEEFIAEIYDNLRNSPVWNETLLVVVYDEHGGFYDHVSPPQTFVPSPDGIVGGEGTIYEFNYTRQGVRVPFIAVSPYVTKGQVVSWPQEAPYKQYEHSSMYATLKRLNGFTEELTNRTAFAAPFDFLFEDLGQPRTDCPTTLPLPPSNKDPKSVRAEAMQEVNGLQMELWAMLTSTIHEIEMGLNGPASHQLKHAQTSAAAKEAFSRVLVPKVGRFAGILKASPKSSPLLHKRMQAAKFKTQGEMSIVVRQIMEILVAKKQ